MRRLYGSIIGFSMILGATLAQGADKPALIGRDALIQRLVPVTGEPVRQVDLHIEFRSNSTELTQQATDQLKEIGEALISEQLSSLAVEINGHTDASGSSSYNERLSKDRAGSVAAWLTTNYRIKRSRLTVQGFGETRLLDAVTPTAARNRRVEIVTREPVVVAPVGSVPPAGNAPIKSPSTTSSPSSPPDRPGGMRAIN